MKVHERTVHGVRNRFLTGSCFEFHSYYFCLIPPKSGTESEYIATKTYYEFNSPLYHPRLSCGSLQSAFIPASKQWTVICKLFHLAADSWQGVTNSSSWQASPGSSTHTTLVLQKLAVCWAFFLCVLSACKIISICFCVGLCAALKHLYHIAVPVLYKGLYFILGHLILQYLTSVHPHPLLDLK